MIIASDINNSMKSIKPLMYTAGEMIRKQTRLQIGSKEHPTDLVTNVDREIEKFLISQISQLFPTHQFLAEESFPNTKLTNSKEFTWVIDPIDGTMNFIHGYPRFSISVALCLGKEIIAGWILDVESNDLYMAIKGEGSYKNDLPIQVSTIPTLNDSLIALGSSAAQWHEKNKFQQLLGLFIGQCHGIRILGSSCLDLSSVATGSIEGFWHYHLSPWDIAAGAILIREAGGSCTDITGSTNIFGATCIIASNGEIQDELIQLLRSAPY